MPIGWTQLFVAVVALASTGGASALGFGPIRSSVTLGQPLNLAVPVNLAEGETLSADCASAEVTAGEIKLPPGTVRVRVTQGRDLGESVLRVTTTVVVEEPVLTVLISAGCPTRLTRELLLLADPPLLRTASEEAEAASPRVATVVPPPTAAPRAAQPASETPAVTRPRATRPPPPSRAARAAEPSATAAAPAPAAASAPERAAAARAPERPGSKPRLQLEAGQVSTSQMAVLAAQQQASAAQAAASAAEAAASAAAERLRAMEGEVTRLRADAKVQTDAMLQLRQQLALDRAERDKPSPLVRLLLGALAGLAVLAAWLGWRLRRQAKAPERHDWWDRSQMTVAPARSGDSQVSAFPASRAPSQQPIPSAPTPWADSPASAHGGLDSLLSPPTLPAPTPVTISPPLPREDEGNRAVSVDEQIDLEQQADFFIALGHDDAAIDLLMAHLRSTGGGIPLPYLKLLEIHRRRGQREAYERTRVRFNQRFNSVAPDWDTDPKSGRSLEDYPLVIGRVQHAWPAPLDAMAELEAMLFRRGAEAELFDLPAYQELLFLYMIARDLHQSDSAGGGMEDIDLLLPIGGRSAPIAAPEGKIMLRPEFSDGEPLSLDLDLSADQDVPSPAADATAPPVDAQGQTDKARPQQPEDDFLGGNPDARPTR